MENFYGFVVKEFEFEGKKAIIAFADEKNRKDKWLFKTEYFGAFPSFEVEMLKRGYNVAHVDNETRWCRDTDSERQIKFTDFLAKEYKFNKKCVPVGMSCGGMQAIFFAAKAPEKVAALYLDAPVVNFLSVPASIGRRIVGVTYEEFYQHRGISIQELISFRNHPLDHFDELGNAGLPIMLVCGDSDQTVPFDENGKLLYDYYKKHRKPITLILKEGRDHHPHGLDDNSPIIDFVEKYY